MRHTATQKVWVTEDRTTLVPDGHEDARLLVARQGQSLDASELSGYSNAHEFFDGFAKVESAEVSIETEFENPDDSDPDPQPKKKHGKRK